MKGDIVLTDKEKSTVILGIERLQVEAKKLNKKAEAMNDKGVMDKIREHYEMLEGLKTKFL